MVRQQRARRRRPGPQKRPGVYVQITITCVDGQRNTSAWRYGYAKAECSYGVDWEDAVYDTK
ncbi:hypothetical protein [Streptomyces inhibens]|uniref:hypothetical protein n=1 Tax=Streptomyces inhibens TaxID=2293571 RepID=UPI001EE6E6C4|nr:hypothetical protein [Streptomyces inhibens]UKY54997.1 hypothetical protein KI385_43860 [Streptomyces inhibens]